MKKRYPGFAAFDEWQKFPLNRSEAFAGGQ
jgi:hypothetical protein